MKTVIKVSLKTTANLWAAQLWRNHAFNEGERAVNNVVQAANKAAELNNDVLTLWAVALGVKLQDLGPKVYSLTGTYGKTPYGAVRVPEGFIDALKYVSTFSVPTQMNGEGTFIVSVGRDEQDVAADLFAVAELLFAIRMTATCKHNVRGISYAEALRAYCEGGFQDETLLEEIMVGVGIPGAHILRPMIILAYSLAAEKLLLDEIVIKEVQAADYQVPELEKPVIERPLTKPRKTEPEVTVFDVFDYNF